MFSSQECKTLAFQGFLVKEDFFFLKTTTLEKFVLSQAKISTLGGTGKGASYQKGALRTDSMSWLDDPLCPHQMELGLFFKKCQETFNKELFTNISFFESMAAHYQPLGYYKKHKDTFIDNNTRVLSMVIYANSSWEESDGGCLRLHLDGGRFVDIPPKNGTCVVFDSKMEHEVLLNQKDRFSVACWFHTQ